MRTLEEQLQKVQHIIEATTFEQSCLWEKYHDKVIWEQINSGHGKTIEHLENRPVFMSFMYARINGVLVLFWHITSEVADYKMAEDFLLDKTNLTKRDLCDATNNGILSLCVEEDD